MNILLDRQSVTELIQNEANPKLLVKTILDLLNSIHKQNEQFRNFVEIRKILGKKSASDNVSRLILDIIN